ncbi:MAG TPA: aminotransferase class I/II-fold pyridoxal phosphate-dependent enzyme, partial [Thermomicrobiales bacterium]|nr:aminotransferase class I/II-fold pyridoxal phosphate-dependent enzyme [Thermomicrobiales bacterium]
MNSVYAALPTTIFEIVSETARKTGAVNLGQGFPDDPGPEDVRRKAAEAVVDGWNQYPPMLGLPELRQAVASHYARHQGLDLDPSREIMVTSGATEAIAGALFALIEPGDEVILFPPVYDAYTPLVRRAGGIPVFVPLTPPDWEITREALEAAVTPKTRFLLFNNPLNPAAKVFPRSELEILAAFCIEHDLIAICDEVWEHV